MMIAGPALVDYAMPGPHYDKNELGGSHVHVTNGAIDDEAASEDEAFAMARRFLSYLPTSVDELPPRAAAHRRPRAPRRRAACRSCPATRATSTRCVDHRLGRGPRRRRHVVVLRDRPAVGQVDHLAASPASTAGPSRCSPRTRTSTAGPGRRRRRRRSRALIDLASTFHLPLVHLVDCPGFLIGLQSEQEATIRHGSRALAALGECPSPYCSVVIRKAFGVAGAANNKAGSLPLPLRVAVGRLGLAADRGRHRGGLQGRARRGARPRRAPCGDPGSARPSALTVPERRSVRHRGHHRSARHAPARLPVGRPRRTRATTRTGPGCASARELARPSAGEGELVEVDSAEHLAVVRRAHPRLPLVV